MESLHAYKDSNIPSLQDYMRQLDDFYTLSFYLGGHLIQFDLKNDSYCWNLFPLQLAPGYYKLCLLLPSRINYQPISAYGMIFAPGEKVTKHPIQNPLGYGFQITPAIASANQFLTYQNTTDFKTNFDGVHQIGVTTTYWTEEVSATIFEVMLLKKKRVSEISSFRPNNKKD